jgi:hypothetical protein
MMRKQRQDPAEDTTEDPVPLVEGAEVARRLAKQWLHEGAELIPVTHLSLDLAEPINGWEPALLERGLEIVEDNLGRPCVRREVLGDLLREERDCLARIEAEGAARAAAAVAPVPAGVPAIEGGSPLQSIMAHDPGYQTPAEEFGQRPKPNFLVEELEAGARQQAAARAEVEARKGKDR